MKKEYDGLFIENTSEIKVLQKARKIKFKKQNR